MCHLQYLTELCGCPRLVLFSAVKNVDICLGYFIQSWILIQFLQIWLQFNNSRPEWSNFPLKFLQQVKWTFMQGTIFSQPPSILRQLQFPFHCPGEKKSEFSTIFSHICSMVLLFIRMIVMIPILKWEINKKITHYTFSLMEMCEILVEHLQHSPKNLTI